MSNDTPLKIAIVSDCLFPINHGGAERVYRAMADAFAGKNHTVIYVTRRQWPDSTPPQMNFDIAPIWEGELYDQSGTRKPFAALKFALSARRFFASQPAFDLVLVSATPTLNVLLTRSILRAKRSYTVVDWLEVWSWKKWLSYSGLVFGAIAWAFQGIAIRLGEARIAISERTERQMNQLSVSPAIIRNDLVSLAGAPPEAVKADERAPGVTLLFVGRHIADKNLQLLPEVVRNLDAKLENFEARVVGSGPVTKDVIQLANDLGVSHKIKFLGRIPDHQLEREFEAASILFFPSVREGFGLVVTEAAKWGTPSVVVQHPDNAASDLIIDGINGYISPSTSPADLELAILNCVKGGASLRHATQEWYRLSWQADGIGRTTSELIRRTRLFRSPRGQQDS